MRDGSPVHGDASALVLEADLDAARDWESEHGEITVDELAWADGVLDAGVARTT